MKAIKLAEPWQVACVELDKPTPKPGEALIRIVTAGICGSDIGAFRGTNGLVSYPRVIGHELAGIVESIPADNKKGIRPGDRVVVDPYLYCGHCYPCRIGRTNCCTGLKVLGVHVDGGMAEYYCHPADMLIKIPDGMTWEEAAMAEPLTISLHGIHRGGLKAGEYCAIIGAGPIGLVAGMVAQAYGAHAILLDLVQERLDFCQEPGHRVCHQLRRRGPGAAHCRDHRRRDGPPGHGVLRRQPRRAPDPGPGLQRRAHHAHRLAQKRDQPAHRRHHQERDRHPRARTSAGEFEEALELIRTKRVDMNKILTRTVTMDEAPATIIDIEKNPGNYMKVVVRVSNEE